MLKIARSIDRVLDPHNALTEHQKALAEQYARELVLESYRRAYPTDAKTSALLDALIGELLAAKPGELMALYLRHTRMFPQFAQNVRYRAALSRILSRSHRTYTVIKKASFYSRYGELHNDGSVTRTEPQNQGEMKATTPQETSDAQPLFSPGKETLVRKKRGGPLVSSHAHLQKDPDSAESPGGRPSLNVDEMNTPSRESRNFESF